MNRAFAHWFIDGGFIFNRDLGRRQTKKAPLNAIQSLWQSLPYLGLRDGLVFLILKVHFVQLTSADFLATRYYSCDSGNTICDDTLSNHRRRIPGKRSRVASKLVMS